MVTRSPGLRVLEPNGSPMRATLSAIPRRSVSRCWFRRFGLSEFLPAWLLAAVKKEWLLVMKIDRTGVQGLHDGQDSGGGACGDQQAATGAVRFQQSRIELAGDAQRLLPAGLHVS